MVLEGRRGHGGGVGLKGEEVQWRETLGTASKRTCGESTETSKFLAGAGQREREEGKRKLLDNSNKTLTSPAAWI